MNRKQIVCMWIGIAFVVFVGFVLVLMEDIRAFRDYGRFFVWMFLATLVTAGLIYTFRDKKDKRPKDEQKG